MKNAKKAIAMLGMAAMVAGAASSCKDKDKMDEDGMNDTTMVTSDTTMTTQPMPADTMATDTATMPR